MFKPQVINPASSFSYFLQIRAVQENVKDNQLTFLCCFRLLCYFFVDNRTPERRCSSRTFRYGYLVTT